jgi:Xaa-Pro aminopeptidase
MADFRFRLEAMQAKMDEKDLDLVVLGSSPDFQYLTGSLLDWRRFRDLSYPADTVFIPLEGDPVILVGIGSLKKIEGSWIEDVRGLGMFEDFKPAVKEIIQDLVGEPKRVAIGEYTWGTMVLTIANFCRGAKFSSAEGMMDDIRSIKSKNEVDKLRKVAKLTDDVMERIIHQIEEGDTMRETGLKIETMGRMVRASDVSFPSTAGFCKSGSPATDDFFNYESDMGLEERTSIAFDVGFVLNGYCSDWGRSFYFGDPEKHIENAYPALMTAVIETMDAIGEEINKVNEIFPFIEKVCEREGYGDYLRNRHPYGVVGHQIGVEDHEAPWLKPENEDEIVDGMVFCIEPKLWNKGEYYLRVEDMVLIKNGKAESLTNYDREHFIL